MNETIKINGRTFKLTPEYRRRITDAMIETQNLLNKELAYSEDLQHKDRIQEYQNHIAKLQNMIG